MKLSDIESGGADPSAAEPMKLSQVGQSVPPNKPWYQQALHGFEAPMVGTDVLAAQAEQHLPFIPEKTAARDLSLAEQEKKAFEAQGSPHFSAWEMLGNLASPLNYLVGDAAPGASLMKIIGRAATAGAGSALVQPEHGPKELAEGALGGAAAGTIANPLVRAIAGNTISGLDKFIKENFERAVKPSVVGKSTFQQAERYGTKVGLALNSIIDNKAGLHLRDEYGQPVAPGTLPQSLDQFSQAIDQTKQAVFAKYDAMAKAAGQQGIRVPLNSAIAELQKVGSSTTMRDLDPKIAAQANAMAATLARRGTYSPEEAQAAIQHLNASLDAFYKNPNFETASRAGVSALIAAKLRQGLDQAVAAAQGPGYQELKNQYGALRTLESDVVKRAIVVSRQEVGRGLMGRIGDIASADEVIRGLLHFNPASVATGAGIRAFTGFVRHLHNPNRAVKRLFSAAERRQTLQPSPLRETIARAVQRTAPVAGAIATQAGP